MQKLVRRKSKEKALCWASEPNAPWFGCDICPIIILDHFSTECIENPGIFEIILYQTITNPWDLERNLHRASAAYCHDRFPTGIIHKGKQWAITNEHGPSAEDILSFWYDYHLPHSAKRGLCYFLTTPKELLSFDVKYKLIPEYGIAVGQECGPLPPANLVIGA
jgi:hypothetical protein